jgi:DNA (cytosine-5)-methyltransferase 1
MTRRLTTQRSTVSGDPLAVNGGASTKPEKTFAEFFSGIGLVEEGLRPSGWRCIYANDIDARKQAMHAARNGPRSHYHLEDVGKTAEVVARIPQRPFLATASFPCIDLSLAGRYQGFNGVHSSTFFAFLDVLKALAPRRPRLVLLENVVGFLTSRRGEDFVTAARSLAELGYWLDAFVLNASHFVPQSRPRVFVIGLAEEVWRGGAPDRTLSPLRPAAVLRAMEAVQLPTGWLRLDLLTPPERPLRLEDVLDSDESQEWWNTDEVERHYRMMSDRHRRRVDSLLSSGTTFLGTAFRRIRQGVQRAEVRFDGLAGCLRTPRGGSGKQIVLAVDAGRLRMRWMSPREYARLQGAPDFPLTVSSNRLLYGFADAVCVPAIRWIDQHVLTPLFDAATAHSSAGGADQRCTSGNSIFPCINNT